MVDLKKFKRPVSKHGIHPFWFWNGEMSEEQILFQIGEMADKGVTGFFICARQGMSIPYLSEEWFKKVNYAIEVAHKHQMNVWLYDEYPYPSGIAGGEVILQHPDAKQLFLKHVEKKLSGETETRVEIPWGNILFAQAVPVDEETGRLIWAESIDVKDFIGNLQVEPVFQKAGLTAYNQKRFFTYQTKKVLQWTPPKGNWEFHCFLEEEIHDFKYYGTYVDPCHPEAMETFIRLTHEQYAKKLRQHFGKTVKGVFTDETHLLGRYPWSPQLVKFIQEEHRYDIRDYLHMLIFTDGNMTAKVRYDYFQSINILLRKSYHQKIYDWCEEYGLEYIAEVPSVRMSTQIYSHIPGGDSAHEKLGRSLDWVLKRYFYGFRKNPKMISSLSRQMGRDQTLIESFHSIGWSMTLQDAKWMIDRLAVLGVNFFNFHAFFYTINAMVKHDAPPSQFIQNPYWQHYRLLGDYTSRISYILSQGNPVRSIAVLDPTTSLWTHMGNPFKNDFSYSGNDEKEKERLEILKQHWSDICIELTTSYKEYDHLDPELLSRAVISNGQLKIGKGVYNILILPPITNIELEAWKVMKEFMNQGGTVIANGLLPYEAIENDHQMIDDIKATFGLPDDFECEFWTKTESGALKQKYLKGTQNAYFIPNTAYDSLQTKSQSLFEIINKYVPERILFAVENGEKSFLMQHRELSDQSEIVFISNQEGKRLVTTLSINIHNKNNCSLYRLDLETGDSKQLAFRKTQDTIEVDLAFEPYQSHLIQLRVEENKVNDYLSNRAEIIVKENDHWKTTILQDNMLRMNTFDLKIAKSADELDDSQNEPMKVEAKTFIDQCEDLATKQMLPVSFSQTFGTPMKTALRYPISVVYETTFDVITMPTRSSLVMDKDAISGDLDIFINGERVSTNNFRHEFVYDHNNVVCNVERFLKKGENIVQVKGKIHSDWEGLVDSLYLRGDFGVEFDKNLHPQIIELPTVSDSLIGPYNGLPYFAGTILFSKNIHLASKPTEEEFSIRCNAFEQFHECAEVIVNGTSLGVKAWSPYEWIGRTNILNKGENLVEVKVTNTLIGLLEGKYFDYEAHQLVDVRSFHE